MGCKQCAPHWYQDLSGQKLCKKCDYSCPAGQYHTTCGGSDAGTCELCAAGTYTSSQGNTACEACTEGYLCVEGSSAPQPCRGGTHANQTFLNITGFRDCPLTDLPMLQVLVAASEKCFVPLTVGGGIRDMTDASGVKSTALQVRRRRRPSLAPPPPARFIPPPSQSVSPHLPRTTSGGGGVLPRRRRQGVDRL